MAGPDAGAAPLAKTFLLARALSIIAMIAIIGVTANFVAEMVSMHVNPPNEIIGTLVIASFATLYSLISIPFFYASTNLTLLLLAGADAALLLAFATVSVVLGKPLSFLNCLVLDNGSAASNAESAWGFTQALAHRLDRSSGSAAALPIALWAQSTRTNCFETKAIWGLCIVLCILFFCTAIVLPALWFKARRARGAGKPAAV